VFESSQTLIINVLPPQPAPVDEFVAALSKLLTVIDPNLNEPEPEAFANAAAGVTVIELSQATAWIEPWPNVIGEDPMVILEASVVPRTENPAIARVTKPINAEVFRRAGFELFSKLKISI
jgi:hypothetical protein